MTSGRKLTYRPPFQQPNVDQCATCEKYTHDDSAEQLRNQWTCLPSDMFDWSVIGKNEWQVKLRLADGTLLMHNDKYHVTCREEKMPSLITCERDAKRRKAEGNVPSLVVENSLCKVEVFSLC